MAHLYHVQEWQSTSGRWFCNDVEDLSGVSAKWWIPCRMLGISPIDYILLLINEFKVSEIKYNREKDYLFFYWNNYNDCHKYALWINKCGKRANLII